jgi:sialate O-acetylesterase
LRHLAIRGPAIPNPLNCVLLKIKLCPNTGQAVTLDIGSLETIHPSNKRDVGERLARWALAKDYKQNSLAFSGPVCASVKSSGDNIILEFDIGAESLVAGGSGLKEFELVYADGSTEEVSASILRNTIMLEMDRGNKPTAVRYAWKNGSEASLFNSAELPASTFSMEIEF